MKRLTTDDEKSIVFFFNTFYAKDGEVWVRGGGPGPDYQDVTLVQWIRSAASKHGLDIIADDPESLGDEMYDALQYGDDTVEGIVALMHAAAVQAAEMRGRLQLIENILGDDYDLDRLRELIEADQAGRCVVLPCKANDTLTDGGIECRADHWNIFLTAFTLDGHKVRLLNVEGRSSAERGTGWISTSKRKTLSTGYIR